MNKCCINIFSATLFQVSGLFPLITLCSFKGLNDTLASRSEMIMHYKFVWFPDNCTETSISSTSYKNYVDEAENESPEDIGRRRE